MRRAVLAVFVLLLVLALGGYAAWWWTMAGGARQAVLDWAEARRVEGWTVGWDRIGVGGFPFTVRVRIDRPVLGQSRPLPGWEAHLPVLVGEAAPWAPRSWRLQGAEGGRIQIAPAEARPPIVIEIAALNGTVEADRPAAAPDPAGTAVAIEARDIRVDAERKVAIDRASARAVLPKGLPPSHRDVWTRGSLRLVKTTLPFPVPPFGQTVDLIDAVVAVKGAIPGGPRPQAMAQWRDQGGTLEAERVELVWGALSGTANATLALDQNMQPMGSGTASIQGYGEIVDALVASGQIKPGDALLARLGLGVLAKLGPDGRRHLEAPVTLQNSELKVAQIRVARLPRFTWE